jgi:hypothetical protein
MKLLITFGNVAFEGYLLRNWHDSMLVALPGTIGPYRDFMLLYRDEEAYRDLVFGMTVGIISLSHLLPGRLNGIRVFVHRQLSPEPGRQGKGGDQLP